MKKTHIIPTTKVVNVELHKMIAASEQVSVGSNYSGGTVLSRESEWEDDEEEDW